MGYTNYWTFKKSTTKAKYNSAKLLVANIVKFAMDKKGYDKILANGHGEKGTKPILDDVISFNGIDDDSHETFYMDKDFKEGFNFTKTARKPYDAVVVACQCALKFVMGGDIKISSDGAGYYQEKLDIDDEILYGIKLFIDYMVSEGNMLEKDVALMAKHCCFWFLEGENGIANITDSMMQVEVDKFLLK